MDIFAILFLSIIQGLTEWLPISSSGHLVIFEKIFNIKDSSLEFDIFLHFASLVVILIFFRFQIIKIIKEKSTWIYYIIISNIFTFLIGYFLYNYIYIFRNLAAVSDWLLFTTLILIITIFSKEKKDLNWKHAIILGILQGFAVIPGISRSGVLIASALIMGIKRKQAFLYGFLVAIPAFLGSFLLTMNNFNFNFIYLYGFFVTIFVSYLTLILLRFIVKSNKLYLFAIYTLFLSLIIKFIIIS